MNKISFTKTLTRAALLLMTSCLLLGTIWAQQGVLVSTPTPKPSPAQAAPNASPSPSDPTTAKETKNPAVSNNSSTAASSSRDSRYRIGPGDLLEIKVIRAPELSKDSVRVDQSGMIRIPMIDEDVRAACLTEGELSKEIVRRYKFYKNDPKVDVFVKEYQSPTVALIGAVNEPGQFKLQRQVTLLELLTYVKGPTEKAGRSINVIHTSTRSPCEEEKPDANPTEIQTGLVAYRLQEVMRGDANPVIQPGDIITVPEADQIYVVGNVVKPSTFPLREPITVTRAIAMAGGVLRDTKSDKIRIVRQEPGSTTKQEIYVDLKAIEKKKSEDISLQANDIVDVPESGTKSFLRSLLGTVAPAVSQLPVRVIP